MAEIRQATAEDAGRIAEIYVMNYRVNFYPFFCNDEYYFGELNVLDTAAELRADAEMLSHTYVYDDGIIKGFCRVKGERLDKLFVEPVFQSGGIGEKLLEYAVEQCGCTHLWALEYNRRGIKFYERHGFSLTGEKIIEDEWVPLLKMELT